MVVGAIASALRHWVEAWLTETLSSGERTGGRTRDLVLGATDGIL